jgi:hypothetical protein
MADDVQPADAGQGADGTDSGYAQYLDSVAPEIREQVEPLFKEFDGNVTKKFQEHAEYRKGWQPYEELGLRDVPPEQLQQLLSFAQMATDEGQFDEWLTNVATERGLLGGEEEAGDELGLGLDEDLMSKLEERLTGKVSELISPLQERFEQQDQQQLVDQTEAEIGGTLDALLAEHKNLPEGAAEGVKSLAYRYAEEPGLSAKEVIEKGFSDYLDLIGQGEKALFTKKSDQPSTPEGPGAASTAPEKITSFDDPRLKQQAREILKNSQ